MTEELEKPIGTKEQEKLSAGSVIVQEIKIEPPKEGSKAKLVNFYCKHPDRSELVKLNNAAIRKVQGNNVNIKSQALWYNLDDDGNIAKGSTIATLIEFYKKKTLQEFIQQSIDTEAFGDDGWLVIKAN